jgi:hypothetical protein
MRKWLIICGALLLVLLIGAIVSNRLAARLPGYVRDRAVSTLREHFASDVEFADFQVSVLPQILIRGGGLALRQHGRTDVPPLIRIRRFSAEAGLWELLQTTRHVRRITLEGLQITVPPRETRPPDIPRATTQEKNRPPFTVLVDQIVSDGAELALLPKEPNKPPRVFLIHRLMLHHAGLGRPMSYHATLSNPLPVGEIETDGEFGPWQRDEPRLTPLAGTYTFTHADLASFRGLAGILSSKGEFKGLLDRINVQGETTTPDFSLGLSGHRVPLETQFHALVDGTNGNTTVDPVHARLLDSDLVARGGVFRVVGRKHRRVLLDAVSTQARLEDLLRLAVKANKPPMTGVVSFTTQIDIPPGEGVVADRLRLDGQFDISSARFTKLNVEKKVAALSRRGRGQTEEQSPGSVVSDLAGKFVLRNGVMTFSNLTFGVPGAFVRLNGTYTLRGEEIDFRGTLRLQATLSQTTRGWKSILLKPIDPLFERGGAGTLLPIRITGTGSDPQFGLDIGRAFKPSVTH